MMKGILFQALVVLATLPAFPAGNLMTMEYDLLDGYCGLKNQLLWGVRPGGRRAWEASDGRAYRFNLTDKTDYVVEGKKVGLDGLEKFCSDENGPAVGARQGGFARRFSVELTHAPLEAGIETINAMKVEVARRGEAAGWTLKEFERALVRLRELRGGKKSGQAFQVGLAILKNGEPHPDPRVAKIVKETRRLMDAMRAGAAETVSL